jgi:nicotinamidase-related amidase
MSARFSVLALHFQNAVVHPDGVVARRGNAQQVLERKVLSNVKRLFASAREAGVPVIHVACSNPPEPPAVASSAPIYNSVHQQGVFEKGSWGAAFHDDAAPAPGEAVLHHNGILSFPNTGLADLLSRSGTTSVAVCGVATRLVVEAAVYELTDRGFHAYLVEDCCACARAEQHEQSLEVLRNFATIVGSADASGLFRPADNKTGRT